MDEVYAFGISCIEMVQYGLADYADYFELVNTVFNPYYAMEYLFPFVSMFDSVFAAQLLLCLSAGMWLNICMKWWLGEDRPYWWIHETDYYRGRPPPIIQTPQTCETGPGSPSGHSAVIAMELMLMFMWTLHVLNDRNVTCTWWKWVLYPLYLVALVSVMLARMFVAAHFPHQCLLGALTGVFLAPFLVLYVSDPYIWGAKCRCTCLSRLAVHFMLALISVLIAFVTYQGLKWKRSDPLWTVTLAYKYCHRPEYIHYSASPLHALVHCLANMFAYSAAVSPQLAGYRHYTKKRSLIVAVLAAYVFIHAARYIQENIPKTNAKHFYAMHFIVYAIKPLLFLNLLPWLATHPFKEVKSKQPYPLKTE